MSYKERILVIATVCAENGIPYSIEPILDGYAICFPWCFGDVACHQYTGGNEWYVESYGFPWDDGDITVLLPEEAAKNIVDLYFERMGD